MRSAGPWRRSAPRQEVYVNHERDQQISQGAITATTADAQSQPVDARQPFKFGRGKLKRLGSSDPSETMSFLTRNIFP